MATPSRVFVHTDPGRIHIGFRQHRHQHHRVLVTLDDLQVLLDELVLVPLDELETHLQQEQFLGFTKLFFYFGCSPDPNFMEGIASAIRNSLPSLKELRVVACHVASDASLAVFLQNFPPRLSTIALHCLQEDMPKTFQTLGRFQQLEQVILESEAGKFCPITFWCNPKSFGILTDSLEKMPLLRNVKIQSPLFFRPQKCLEELFTVLGSKENPVIFHGSPRSDKLIELVGDPGRLKDQWLDVNVLPRDSRIPYTISQELKDILYNGPTLLQQLKQQLWQAHRRRIFPDSIRYNNGNKQAWVEAMIFFKDGLVHVGEDTFGVFHFLAAQILPHLLSTAWKKIAKISKKQSKIAKNQRRARGRARTIQTHEKFDFEFDFEF